MASTRSTASKARRCQPPRGDRALNHLTPIVYMGYYATRPLSRGICATRSASICIRHMRSSSSRSAAPCITRWLLSGYGAARSRLAESVVVRLFEKLPELRATLNLDVIAAYTGDPAPRASRKSSSATGDPGNYDVPHRHELYRDQVPMIRGFSPSTLTQDWHRHPSGAEIGHSFSSIMAPGW